MKHSGMLFDVISVKFRHQFELASGLVNAEIMESRRLWLLLVVVIPPEFCRRVNQPVSIYLHTCSFVAQIICGDVDKCCSGVNMCGSLGTNLCINFICKKWIGSRRDRKSTRLNSSHAD